MNIVSMLTEVTAHIGLALTNSIGTSFLSLRNLETILEFACNIRIKMSSLSSWQQRGKSLTGKEKLMVSRDRQELRTEYECSYSRMEYV